MDSPPRSILITGCSSGIGLASARLMKARGWRVFATARAPDDVASLKAEGFEAFPLDYRDAVSIETTLDRVLRRTDGTLDALFNNGGYAQAGALEDITTDLIREQFETNLFGWHELTRRVIPLMRRQGAGRLVFCSSILGFVGVRYRGAYVASKYAVEGMADSLRAELHGTGIRVILIEPGPIQSNFRRTALNQIDLTIDIDSSFHRDDYRRSLARRPDGTSASRFRKSPDAVAKVLARALDKRRPAARYRVTVPTRVAWYLRRFLPTRALDWIVRKEI
ncbi:MAG: SDR family NAD(P)-dependent oxidoreductase [Rhizobiales bacterium]|nr:SDR family NAD(P)-dependent oxidoreductase [Hyphomicrobiales bacterium]